MRENCLELLKQYDILPTNQRLQIAKVIFTSQQHVSADKLQHFFKQTSRPISKATIYNTLALFTEKGLLKPIVVDSERVFYDANINHHYHFYNEDSGELIDIATDHINILGLPCLPVDTTLSGLDIIIRVSNIN